MAEKVSLAGIVQSVPPLPQHCQADKVWFHVTYVCPLPAVNTSHQHISYTSALVYLLQLVLQTGSA